MDKKLHDNRIGKKMFLRMERCICASICFLLCMCSCKGTGSCGILHPTELLAYAQEGKMPEKGEVRLRDTNATVTIQCGMQGKARFGRNCVISGVIEPAATFEGSLAITLTDLTGKSVVYEVQPDLTGRFSLILPLNRYYETMTAGLYSKDGGLLTERSLPLECYSMAIGEVIGVFAPAETPEAYEYLQSFGNEVIFLSERMLPITKEGYDFFDVICLDGIQVGQISEETLTALREWVASGGTLVVGTGKNGDKTLSILKRNGIFLGNVYGMRQQLTRYGIDETAVEQVDELLRETEIKYRTLLQMIHEEQGESSEVIDTGKIHLGDAFDTEFIRKNPTALYAAETAQFCLFSLPESENIYEENGEKLLASATFGKGKVEYFSVPLARMQNSYLSLYFALLIRQYQGARANRVIEDRTYSEDDFITSVGAAQLSEDVSFPMLPYALLLFFYLTLAVGVWYLLVKRAGKRLAVYAVIPIMAGVTLLIGYVIGGKTRIREPHLSYVEIVTEEREGVTATVGFTVTSPSKRPWKMTIPSKYPAQAYDTNVYGIYDLIYQADRQRWQNEPQKVKISYKENKTEYLYEPVAAFSTTAGKLFYATESPKLASCHMQQEMTEIVGTITNSSDMDFLTACLYVDGTVIDLGYLEKGQSVAIENRSQAYVTTAGELYETGFWNSMNEAIEGYFVREYLQTHYIGNRNACRLIVVTKEASKENPLLGQETAKICGGRTIWDVEIDRK